MSSEAHPELQAQARRLRSRGLATLAEGQGREAAYRLRVGGLVAELGKHWLDDEARNSLFEILAGTHWPEARDRLLSGGWSNQSEGRAVLHSALRAREGEFVVGGRDLGKEALGVRARIDQLGRDLRSGEFRGASSGRISDVVNVGIGGSELGPRLVVEALGPSAKESLRTRFVSAADGEHLRRTLTDLDPATTLVCLVSKSFTTSETMLNAHALKAWACESLGPEALARNFIAATSEPARARAFGISPDNIFEFWPAVGGRFSVWSAAGISAHLAMGAERYGEFLDGARAMDRHFATADAASNLPFWLAALSFFYGEAFGAHAHAMLAYDDRLRSWPAYVQQLSMESNGKGQGPKGEPRERSAAVTFGGTGANAQHAFMQLLHQGTHFVPTDFFMAKQPGPAGADLHRIQLANAIAQSRALMTGTGPRLDAQPHLHCAGGQPSTTFVLDELNATNLGALMACFEHKTFLEGLFWGVNSFDQWGVQLGKGIAGEVESRLQAPTPPSASEVHASLDASSEALIALLKGELDG